MKVKHAHQTPRVKPSHISVLYGMLSIRDRIAKTLEFASKNNTSSIETNIVQGWLQDINKLNIQACLKGELKHGKTSSHNKGEEVKKLKARPKAKKEKKAS